MLRLCMECQRCGVTRHSPGHHEALCKGTSAPSCPLHPSMAGTEWDGGLEVMKG